MIAGETDVAHRHSLRVSLAALLILLGFVSITLYMGSTIFYPMFHFNEFVGQALHDGIKEVLVSKYAGYLPIMIFGIAAVIAGNWLWYSKKEIDNTILIMTAIPFFTMFVVLILKYIEVPI